MKARTVAMIRGHRERKTLYLCGICNLVQRSATTDRTLVKRLGQRFESLVGSLFMPICR